MIIWKGFGFLVVILAFAGFLGAQLAVNGYMGDEQYYQTHGWPKALGAAVAAVPIWFLGRFLNSRPGRRLVDPATGETVTLRATHDLFFIRMEFWAPILLVVAMVAAAAADETKPVLLDGQVSLAMPAGFTELSTDEIAAKYPRQHAPGRAFGNERRTVTFGAGLTQQPLKPEQLADAEKGMGDQMARMIPKLEWLRRQIVTINGQRWIHFSMITPAVDTNIRNEMFVTSVQGKAFIINLNATVAEYPKYEDAITAMRASLRVVAASAR